MTDAKNRASTAATEQEQAKLKITHLTKRIREEEPRAKKAKEQNATLFKDLEKLRSAAEKLEAELTKLGYEEGKEEETRREQTALEDKIRNLTKEANGLRKRVKGMDFNYTDPTPDFDRSKVKGLVAQLFTLDEDKIEAGTALEICAGGRLYNVVVDTQDTGSQLLQKGQLVKRVTLLPLNKIVAYRTPADTVVAAQRIAPGKVELAIELVGYEEEIARAMEYVFGSTFICKDADTAKSVTFDPKVRSKSVTFQGDVYDPSGTLSGGSAPSSSGVLITIQKINALDQQIAEANTRLNDIKEMMEREKKKLDMARGLKRELELKKHEIRLTEEQINSNSSSSIIHAVDEMKEGIQQAKNDIVDAKKRQEEAAKEVKRIEKDMNEFKNNKGGKLAELQKSLAALKKDVANQSQAMKSMREEFQSAQLELEQAGGDVAAAQESLEEVNATIEAQEAEIKELKDEHARVKDVHDIALAQLEDERAKLSGFDDELQALEDATRSKHARIAEEGLEKQKLGHEVEKFHKEQQTSKEAVTRLEREHEWIEEEQEQFGRPGTPYEFQSVNISECRTSLKNLTERFQGMKKKINPKVMNMIDSVEKKEVALKQMLRTVIKDKRKIEETIVELDRYKKEALQKTHTKVSGDFGNIFAELLPGSFAKLVPPEGKEVTDGLEVKVQLGKVWKQSLTELSGGQRSLIALSLIMALLQFKPAPMYILDEVDAALDLSHTQNIGRLIKTRFKGSQFIVVSLKDGMFQNANRYYFPTHPFLPCLQVCA
jgi:structural maintenance of chromosome 2